MNHNVYFYCRDRNVPSVSFGFEFKNSLAETRSACNPHPQRKDETVAGCQGEIATQHIYTLTRIMQGGGGNTAITDSAKNWRSQSHSLRAYVLVLATCYLPWVHSTQLDHRQTDRQ